MAKKKSFDAIDEKYWRLMRRIAANIKATRKRAALTQEDMLGLGFERRWLQRIESGRYSVSLPTLDRLARALKVDISELFK